MSKMQIIMIAVIAVVCFAGAFGFAVITRSHEAPAVEANSVAEPNASHEGEQPKTAGAEVETLNQKSMSEKQVKLLVQSLRNRITDYDKKDQDLAVRQQQVQSAQDMLQKDVNELNTLRLELATEAAAVKEEKQKLENFQILIKADEAANLRKTAVIYDKMDAASAGKILINMCTSRQLDDAVKILNYMNERNAAKVLGEISTADPKIAADISQALKRLKEVK